MPKTGAGVGIGEMFVGRIFRKGPVGLSISYTNLNAALINIIHFNPDFLLASAWQKGASSAIATVAADYCTTQHISLASAIATTTSSARAGLDGKHKCTFNVASAPNFGAPSMKLTVADTVEF